LNIVHFLPEIRLADGGVVRAVLDWCAVFAARGHRVTLLAWNGQDVPGDWSAPNSSTPSVVLLPAPTKAMGRLGDDALHRADAAMASADVLHLHTPWFESNRQLAELAARHGLPYLVSIHGMLDDWSMAQKSLKKRLYLALVGRRFLNRAARVHCTAEAELAQARKWFDNSNTAVLPYLVDLTPFETLPGPAAALASLPPAMRHLPKLLFLSRLHEKKGVDVLLRAAARLRDEGRTFALIIAGTGEPAYERSLKELAAQLRLSEIVHFTGLVTGTSKLSLYQAADVFVLPTQQENFGLVLIESLACGTPIVTTRGTDIWQELEQAGGVIAEPAAESIATAIARLLDDPAEQARRGERGRQWTFQTLAVAPLAERYEALYRQIAVRRARHP